MTTDDASDDDDWEYPRPEGPVAVERPENEAEQTPTTTGASGGVEPAQARQPDEWRRAIDFCLKKDGAICWVAPGSPRCLAVQSADSVPILIALRARLVLASPEGTRELPVEELYRNDGIDYLTKRPDELLTEIRIPSPAGWSAAYRKLRRRGSFDFPVLSVGAAVRREGGTVAEARLVLSLLAAVRMPEAPVRAYKAGSGLLEGIDAEPVGREALGLDKVSAAFHRLNLLAPLAKPQFIKACVAVAFVDGSTNWRAASSLRTLCAALDCPLPPQVDAAAAQGVNP